MLFHQWSRRRRPLFIVALASTASLFLLAVYTSVHGTEPLTRLSAHLTTALRFSPSTSQSGSKGRGTCSPREYAGLGQWEHRPYYTRPSPLSRTSIASSSSSDAALASRLRLLELAKAHSQNNTNLDRMERKEDALRFARYEGCASTDNYWWQFAANIESERDDGRWGRRFPRVMEWEWVPGGRCASDGGLREWDAEEVVRELVERGGWLLVGDSVTGNHYFSLSCLLYPHVVENVQTSWERDRPQHLYLNPTSPLVSALRFPPGFNISSTPLVTFRRVDLLWSPDQLVKLHKELHPEFYRAPGFQLFGEEAVWSMPLETYLSIFFGEEPGLQTNYRTMVVSTAGHWTTGLFHGYHKGDDASSHLGLDSPSGPSQSPEEPVLGYDGLLVFFREVMERWIEAVQRRIDVANAVDAERAQGSAHRDLEMRKREVVVRAYLPGHDDCHNHYDPWEEMQEPKPFWNWKEIPKFNGIWETLLKGGDRDEKFEHDNIHYLGIDRPGRLRPDGHVASDCLHIMTGAGVLEGWTHYIWHYITREI